MASEVLLEIIVIYPVGNNAHQYTIFWSFDGNIRRRTDTILVDNSPTLVLPSGSVLVPESDSDSDSDSDSSCVSDTDTD
jgi:hypothetical protein